MTFATYPSLQDRGVLITTPCTAQDFIVDGGWV